MMISLSIWICKKAMFYTRAKIYSLFPTSHKKMHITLPAPYKMTKIKRKKAKECGANDKFET